MLRKTLLYIIVAGIWLSTAFTSPNSDEKWIATIQLEGKSKPITLVSDAVYGGYNSVDKKIFLFGKNHMFQNQNDNSNAQIFRDLCTTNASGRFQFELNGLQNENPSAKPVSYQGNISFKKKFEISGVIQKLKKGDKFQKVIMTKGDLKALGFQMTEEADKVMTGKFTLTFTSQN